jgi:hypothetical protein
MVMSLIKLISYSEFVFKKLAIESACRVVMELSMLISCRHNYKTYKLFHDKQHQLLFHPSTNKTFLLLLFTKKKKNFSLVHETIKLKEKLLHQCQYLLDSSSSFAFRAYLGRSPSKFLFHNNFLCLKVYFCSFRCYFRQDNSVESFFSQY